MTRPASQPGRTDGPTPVQIGNATPVQAGSAPPVQAGNAPPVQTRSATPVQAGNAPPRRSKVTGGLAALACAACCALPLLIAAGVLTSAGAAILEKALLAVVAGLAVLALGLWWLHRHRSAQRPGVTGRASAGNGCSR
jgi:hypothetical protein